MGVDGVKRWRWRWEDVWCKNSLFSDALLGFSLAVGEEKIRLWTWGGSLLSSCLV